MMRIAGLVMASVNPIMSAHIRAALVMGSRDMTVDGPALRACFPSIPMTTAVEVATKCSRRSQTRRCSPGAPHECAQAGMRQAGLL